MDLPIILAGPILRRVEANSVIIWIATSYPFQMDAKLFKMTKELPEFDIQCKAESIRFGKRLFIYLLKLIPVHGEFPVDTLLGYNLFLKRKSKTLDLGDLGLLNQHESQSIVYGNLKYPSFFINRDLESHVLYGSCRKSHGERDDVLAAGDMELQSTYGDLSKRPSALFLLGDQIYADDVADPLFPIITSLSKRLMGRDEKLSILDKRLEEVPFRNSLNQINGREYIMDHFCKFTSTKSQNHLTLPPLKQWRSV
ncbi:hypothetical protein [Paenisporosarcina sp. TG20]|uniref:hypothetical protein n=1 Tax=Paenisporosarcina sp. TG20 TaxID=1211706 RepID=UPI00030A26D7|nr:hypothetical protein [Paenisporosarcina sp. TG20]